MKKTVTLFVAAALSGAAFAAANDVLITFSTKGPDKYADGTDVLDGERYALCWSTDFSNFSIGANGVATGGKIVLSAPVAKNGHCPTIVFEVNAKKAASEYAGGSYAVYLLDTRKYADGQVVGLAGGTSSVNASGAVGASLNVGVGSVASLATSSSAAASTGTAVPADVPQPEITGIRILDGNVYVTVKGTVPFLAYSLTESATPGGEGAATDAAQSGADSQEEEITLVTPTKEGGAFFKVGRK